MYEKFFIKFPSSAANPASASVFGGVLQPWRTLQVWLSKISSTGTGKVHHLGGRMKCNLGGGSCGEGILVEVRLQKPQNLSVSHASWLGWAVSKGEGSRAFCPALKSWAALQPSTQELADCFWLFPSASLPPGLAQSCKCIDTLNRLT